MKKGNQFIGTMAGLQAVSERMSEMLGEPDQYEEVTKGKYLRKSELDIAKNWHKKNMINTY